jgi:hypothetical protein
MTSHKGQKKITRNNWREDKGKMNDSIQKGTTRKMNSGQNPRDKDTGDEASRDGTYGDPKTEAE